MNSQSRIAITNIDFWANGVFTSHSCDLHLAFHFILVGWSTFGYFYLIEIMNVKNIQHVVVYNDYKRRHIYP